MNLTSCPWVHHDDRFISSLVKTRPSFAPRKRNEYDEKPAVVSNKLDRDAAVGLV
jgi:hypothetical protein